MGVDFRVLETHPLSLGDNVEEQLQELLEEINDWKSQYNNRHRDIHREGAEVVLTSSGLSDRISGGKDPVANQDMAVSHARKPVDGADDVIVENHYARRATTDATVTEIDTISITADRTYFIEARVVARRTGGASGTADDGAAYIVRGTYKTASGTVTLIGSLTAEYTAEDVAGWTATLVISGTTVGVRVTGAATTNITWHSHTIVQYVGS